jgi:hypothetical protein
MAPQAIGRGDRLTIRRSLILTAGIAAGLAIGVPRPFDLKAIDSWRALLTAVLMGVSLVGPLFALAHCRAGIAPLSSRAGCARRRLDWGGLFWFAQGLGVLLLLPPIIAEQFGRDRIRLSSASCLAYVLPLMGLWFVLAALASGLIQRRHLRRAAWLDRCGVWLAVAWSPLGAWIIFEFYFDAFSR